MLGKLIKHEFKAVNRLLLPLHLALILITIVGRFYVQFAINQPYTTFGFWQGIMNFLLVSFYIIALMAICIVTNLYLSVLRPHKNLFGDEGYLMHTLPVPSAFHILAKLIVTTIWGLIDAVLLILSVIAMVINVDVIRSFGFIWSELSSSFYQEMGIPFGIGLLTLLLAVLTDMIQSTLMVYMCLAIGHSMNSHKILASIGIYIGVSAVISIISTIIMGIISLSQMGSSSFMYSFTMTAIAMGNPAMVWLYIWLSIVAAVILGAVFFLVTNYFLKKHLNLE